jgi:hypothetical protein
MTLEQLSEASSVDVGTISALELRDSARSKYATNIAKAFGLTVEQLGDETTDWIDAPKTPAEPDPASKADAGFDIDPDILRQALALYDDQARVWQAELPKERRALVIAAYYTAIARGVEIGPTVSEVIAKSQHRTEAPSTGVKLSRRKAKV